MRGQHILHQALPALPPRGELPPQCLALLPSPPQPLLQPASPGSLGRERQQQQRGPPAENQQQQLENPVQQED